MSDNEENFKVEIEGTVTAETEGAWLIDIGDELEHWVPKSQCDWDEDQGIMEMPEWLAVKEGLV